MELALRQGLEGEVERHDLGDRGGVTRAVGLVGVEHFTRIGVNDDGGITCFGSH